MKRLTTVLALATAAATLAVSASLTLRAQDRPRPAPTLNPPTRGTLTVQDALLKPYSFPFARPTPLDEAAKHLGLTLNAPVAIDRAALDRVGVKMDDTVQLNLEGVRLKTGLKLLLDQLDLTFKVVAEDNLLVITDPEGSDDPVDRVLTQLKSLHNDVHDLQDAVDEVRGALGLDGEGARVRKPTIIEEMPPEAGEKGQGKPKEPPAGATPHTRSRPGA